MTRFMKLADVGLFARSARSDALIQEWWSQGGADQVFDRLYASAPGNDPWCSASPRFLYQRRKYDVIASLIPPRPYRRALDVGCGTGLFSERLAAVADEVVGVDVSRVAIAVAASRNSQSSKLHFAQCDVRQMPTSWEGAFDLITILDTLYYLPPPIEDDLLKTTVARLTRLLAPGGLMLVANHYFFGMGADSHLSRRIHDAFRWFPNLQIVGSHQRPFYLVSLLRSPTKEPTKPHTHERSPSRVLETSAS